MRLYFEEVELIYGYYSWKIFVYVLKKLTDSDNRVVIRNNRPNVIV